MQRQIETTLLDINAAKIRAEKQVEQLKEMIMKKDGEIHGVVDELVKVRKQGEMLEEVVQDLQDKLAAKDKDIAALEVAMY